MKKNTFLKQLLLVLIVFSMSAGFAYGQIPVCGDVDGNGTTDIVDALRIAQCYVGLIQCPSPDAGNVNCDGSIDIVDALMVAQYYVGLLTQLNCCSSQPTNLTLSCYLEFNVSIYPNAYHYPQYSFWVKDIATGDIYTIYVTNRSAGWSESANNARPSALPVWFGARAKEKTQNDYPPIDAVSSATPLVPDTTISWQVPAQLTNKDLEVYLEANISYDYNDDYTYEPNGQPSLIRMVVMNTADGRVQVQPPVIGHGHESGADNLIHTEGLSAITTAMDLFLQEVFALD